MINKQRVEELVSFLNFEKELFADSLGYMDDLGDYDQTLANFNDTIEVVKSVLNEM